MSKNYELLQNVPLYGQAPTFTTGTSATAETVSVPGTAHGAQVLPIAGPEIRKEVLKLVQRLFLIPQEKPPKAVVFAGIDAYAGCHWLCPVAAKLLAISVPGSVCLVEGDFRSPSLMVSAELDSHSGLVDSLRMDSPIREFTRRLGPDNLWLLSAGGSAQGSTVFLDSECMRERIRELQKEFNYLIVNAPPLGAFADGMVLGGMADGVVLVLEANATRREAAVRVVENLRTANISVLGAVLTDRTFPIPEVVYKRL